jgi:hypothetical protein
MGFSFKLEPSFAIAPGASKNEVRIKSAQNGFKHNHLTTKNVNLRNSLQLE